MKVNDLVCIVNRYTDRRTGPYKVMYVSKKGNKVTIARPDFATGKEDFFYQPTIGRFSNDYSGMLF